MKLPLFLLFADIMCIHVIPVAIVDDVANGGGRCNIRVHDSYTFSINLRRLSMKGCILCLKSQTNVGFDCLGVVHNCQHFPNSTERTNS